MGDLVGDQGVQVQVAALHTWRVGLLRTITTPLQNSSLQKVFSIHKVSAVCSTRRLQVLWNV
jgi:hypothetical protein